MKKIDSLGSEFASIELEDGQFFVGDYVEEQSEEGEGAAPPGERARAPLALSVWRAALYVAEAAWRPHRVFFPFRPLSWPRVVCYLVHHNLHVVRLLLVGFLMVLGFFEVQPHCLALPSDALQVMCSNSSALPRTELPVIAPQPALIAELVSLLFLMLAGPVLRSVFTPMSYMQWSLLKAVLYCISLVDVIVSVAGVQRSFRLSPWLRPALLVLFSSWTRMAFFSLVATVPVVLSVLVFLIVFFAVLVWAAILLFNGSPGADIYSDVAVALRDLHVMLTTANFPDIQVAQYAFSSWVYLYYVVFFFLTIYFILPLFLATIYGAYRDLLKQERRFIIVQRRLKLKEAFACLDVDRSEYVGFGLVSLMLQRLNYLLFVPYVSATREHLILEKLDSDHTSRIYLNEFQAILEKLALQTSRRRPRSCAKWCCPSWAERPSHQKLQRFFLQSIVFNTFIDLLVVAQVGLMIWETVNLLEAAGRPDSILGVQIFDGVLVLLFLIEMSLKLFFAGLKSYVSDGVNRFDGVVTLISFVATLVVLVPNAVTDPTLARVFLFLRMFRLFRLLARVPAIRVVLTSYLKLLPLVARAFLLLFVMYYVFALVGVYSFGGLISASNPQLLSNSSFVQAGYIDSSNWNDLGSAFVTLFQLQIVNNWFVIVAGPEMVTSTVARIFFVLWWIFAVLFAVNIFVALVIDSFVNSWKEERRKNPGFYHFRGAPPAADEDDHSQSEEIVITSRNRDLYRALGIEEEDLEEDEETV